MTLVLEKALCLSLLLFACLLPIITLSSSAVIPELDHQRCFHVLSPKRYAHLLNKDYQWAIQNVPFIDFPENDDIQIAYYYRWRMYRKRKLETLLL